MITIEYQGNRRFEVFNLGKSIGHISVHYNPYHAQNRYLDLELRQYDPTEAEELFRLLRKRLSRPLQVMLYSWDLERCAFLVSGGFQRKRQCYEMKVTAADLKTAVKAPFPLTRRSKNTAAYSSCCGLLYDSYAKSHEGVSPLTADKELFCGDLPDTVLIREENGSILHFAFVEENEIAYIGTVRQADFHNFAQALIAHMTARYENILFECDSCDPTAMELKAFFDVPCMDSYDTYILD